MSMTTQATSAETSSRPFPLFSPGQIVATPAALNLLERHGVSPQTILHRHLAGDWGALCSDDVAANEAALRHGSRLLSSYLIAPGVTVWIITDAESDIIKGVRVNKFAILQRLNLRSACHAHDQHVLRHYY